MLRGFLVTWKADVSVVDPIAYSSKFVLPTCGSARERYTDGHDRGDLFSSTDAFEPVDMAEAWNVQGYKSQQGRVMG